MDGTQCGGELLSPVGDVHTSIFTMSMNLFNGPAILSEYIRILSVSTLLIFFLPLTGTAKRHAIDHLFDVTQFGNL